MLVHVEAERLRGLEIDRKRVLRRLMKMLHSSAANGARLRKQKDDIE
jgi:hypothetical protein